MNFAVPMILAGAMMAAVAAADLTPTQFQDGDVVCFIGDSITHSSKYHSHIYDYYLTRFPERKIRFVNCGISGDSAGGGVARLDWDILPHRPTVVSIMMGMNDVNRGLYGKTQPDAQNLAARKQALQWHRDSMEKLARILAEKCHPRFIFLTPSPYDQTVDVPTESLFGVNEALGTCGQYAEELAREYKGGIVDYHSPMTAMNLEYQRTAPKFTLVGSDRVHPGDPGQTVMAYLYLKAQKVPDIVSRFVLDGDTGRVIKAVNGQASHVKVGEHALTFNCLENALPFPIEASAAVALKLVSIEADLDQQVLAIRFRDSGLRKVSIDGQLVGEYTSEQLKAGVNLALNSSTPQYKQAQDVMATNEQRRQKEVRLRSLAQIKIMLRSAKVNDGDDGAVKAYFADFLEKSKVNGVPNGYFKGQFDNYLKTKDIVPQINDEIEALTQRLWVINQPKVHTYRVEW